MKLQEKNNKVEQFGNDTVVEHEMEIRKEDQHVILGIVSHKMYSNAIRTIIQEVGSNARDAHREFGNADRPIRIKLPDRHDNSFYIQDFGVGVDPDRMANVFVNYGASTKRNTNDETGGFGLGAKSPFSYTDQFGIVTVTPNEDGTLWLRQYMAIFEGKRRVVKRIEERPARDGEERGTKIIVPVKPEDFQNFRKWTIDRCRYWSVRPEVISKDYPITWPKDEVDFEGKDGTWQVMKAPSGYNSNYDDRKPKAVVDGIPYPISKSSVERSGFKADIEINKLWNYPLLLHFNTGDISMTATREELDYTVDSTGKAIREKFEEIIKELKVKLNDKISNAKNFIEANFAWNDIKYQYNSIVSSVTWDGHEINGVGFNGNGLCQIIRFCPDATKNTGISRSKDNHVSFLKNMKVVIDKTDNKGVQTNKIARMFEDYFDLKNVYVIKIKKPEDIYSGHAIYKDVKDFDKNGTIQDVHDWLDKEYKLNLYDPIDIESLPKRKPKKRTSTGYKRNNAEVIRKLARVGWRSPFWDKTSLDYKSDSGHIVFLKNRNAYANDDFSSPIGTYVLKKIEEHFDISIHGVLSSHAKKIGKNWTPLVDFIKSEYVKLKKEVDNMQVPDFYDSYGSSNVNSRISSIYGHLPKDCGLVKMISEWKKDGNHIVDYRKKAEKLNAVVKFLRDIDNANKSSYKGVDFASQKGVSSYADKIMKRYPFIFGTDSWNCKLSTKDHIDYIEIMDKHHGPVV